MRIEIASTAVKTMKGTSKRTGNAYNMAMQEAYLHGNGKYPERFEIPLDIDDQGNHAAPYAVGFYVVSDDSYQVREGRLGINSFEMKLTPEGAAARPRAAAAA